MRPLFSSLVLAAFLLTACNAASPESLSTPAQVSTPVPTNTPVPSVTPVPVPQRLPLLRIAVLGETTTTNVWAIFDESGANYWNVATQASYWPSLYQLEPPSLDLQPATAIGTLPPVICDAATCTATVSLRPNLTWTDGSPFTADDVAFTVNTALQFRLELNWQQAYNPDILDHVDALNATTAKFYFKTKPGVADWQYGALLGPIVNRDYWQPRIDDAANLLPDVDLLPTIQGLEGELDQMQANIDALNLSLNTMLPASTEYVEASRRIKNMQDELNSIYNKLQKNRSEYESNLSAARVSLFGLTNTNEPTLGPWEFASQAGDQFENQANLDAPFGEPWFDRARYLTFPSDAAAVNALQDADVDILLLPEGLSLEAASQLKNDPEITLSRNITRSARFLVFNHTIPYLSDPVLHRALACLLDPQTLVTDMNGEAAPLSDFVLDPFWRNEKALLPCSGMDSDARLAEAVRLLKNGGYSWDQEPGVNVKGSGLRYPGEFAIPSLTLLTPAQDSLRDIAADYIARQAETIGLTINVRMSNSDELLYDVYGSRNYDMALLGWRLSVYPAYLCDWFMPWEQNPFVYTGSSLASSGGEGLRSVCEALTQSNDMETAKAFAFQAQSILMSDLPLIPLYSDVRVDAYRNVQYPFVDIIDGLGGLYGAPALAIPR